LDCARVLASFFENPHLPLLRESDHVARLFDLSKQFPNSFLLAWQQQVWPDIG
jgi:hypothetical protein